MRTSLSKMTAEFLREKKRHRLQLAVMVCLAAVVVVGMIATLKHPGHATTQAGMKLACQLEVHQHTEDCRDPEGNLICGKADFVAHIHNDDCRNEQGELICRLLEIKPHTHTEACYSRVETLICALPAAEAHVHTEACYIQERVFVCAQPEGTVHTHTENCHVPGAELICQSVEPDHVHSNMCYRERLELICTLPEVEAHVHTDDCYIQKEEQTIICGMAEEEPHTHTDDCYLITRDWDCLSDDPGHIHDEGCHFILRREAICGLEEGAGGHRHIESCYQYETREELVCGQEETSEAHVHTDDCFAVQDVLICGREEIAENHVHTDECYTVEEYLSCTEPEVILHTHEDGCYQEIVGGNGEVADQILTCGQPEVLLHTHTIAESCFVPISTAKARTVYLDVMETGELEGEETGEEGSKTLDSLNDRTDGYFTMTKERQPAGADPTTWLDADEFHPGDKIRIVTQFKIPENWVGPDEPITYSLPPILGLKDEDITLTTKDGLPVGTAHIDSATGVVTITLHEAHGTINGKQVDFYPSMGLEADMVLTGTIGNVAPGEEHKVTFPGTETTITINDGVIPDLQVKKTHDADAVVDNGDGTKTITYTVRLRSTNGTRSEIKLEDYFTTPPKNGVHPVYDEGSITVVKKAARSDGNFRSDDQILAENIDYSVTRNSEGKLDMTLPELGEMEYYEITYTVTVDSNNYEAESIDKSLLLDNIAKATYNGDDEPFDVDSEPLKGPQFQKTGEYDGNGKFTWTIVVPAGNQGRVLRERPGGALSDLINNADVLLETPTVTVVCGEGKTHTVEWEEMLKTSSSHKGYTIDCNADHIFTIEMIMRDENVPDNSYTNHAGLYLDDSDSNYTEVTGTARVKRQNQSATKETRGQTMLIENGKIAGEEFVWRSKVTVPDDPSWTTVVYHDSFAQEVTYTDENGETVKIPVDHYEVRSVLWTSLDNSIKAKIAERGWTDKITYEIECFAKEDFTDKREGDNDLIRSFTVTFTNVDGLENSKRETIYLSYTTRIGEKSMAEIPEGIEQTIKNYYGFAPGSLGSVQNTFTIPSASSGSSLEKTAKLLESDTFTSNLLSVDLRDGDENTITYRLMYMLSTNDRIQSRSENGCTITLEDVIPAGLMLETDTIKLQYYMSREGADPVYKEYVRRDSKHSGYYITDNKITTKTIDPENGDGTTATKLQIKISTPQMGSYDEVLGIEVVYRCKLVPEVIEELLADQAERGGNEYVYRLKNAARANGGEPVEHRTDVSKAVLSKYSELKENAKDRIHCIQYTLDVNPEARTLNKGNQITLEDSFKVTYDDKNETPFYAKFHRELTTVEVFYGDTGKKQAPEKYTYDVVQSETAPNTLLLTMHLDDATYFQVVYTYWFEAVDSSTELPPSAKLRLTNSANVMGSWRDADSQDTSSFENDIAIKQSFFTLTKTQTGNQSIKVPGAVFAVYRWDEENTCWQLVGDKFTTDDADDHKGELFFNQNAEEGSTTSVPLEVDTFYAVKEVSAPKGYHLSDKVIYFRWNIDNKKWDEMKDTVEKLDGTQFSASDLIQSNPSSLEVQDDPVGPYYIKKVNGVGASLDGVEFNAYTWDADTKNWKSLGTVTTAGGGKITFTPDTEGLAANEIHLEIDGIYALVEKKTQDGYKLDLTPHFYYYPDYKNIGGFFERDKNGEIARKELKDILGGDETIYSKPLDGKEGGRTLERTDTVHQIGKPSSDLEIVNDPIRHCNVTVVKNWNDLDSQNQPPQYRPAEVKVTLTRYTLAAFSTEPDGTADWRNFVAEDGDGNPMVDIWVPVNAKVSLKLKEAASGPIKVYGAEDVKVYAYTDGVQEYVFAADTDVYVTIKGAGQFTSDDITVLTDPQQIDSRDLKDGNWSYTWEDLLLDKAVDNVPGMYYTYVYRVEEINVDSIYTVAYSQTTVDSGGTTTITVTNTKDPDPKAGEISVQKKWAHFDGTPSREGYPIKVELWRRYYKDGEPETEKVEVVERKDNPVLLDGGNWFYRWKDLEEEDGYTYSYFVREYKEDEVGTDQWVEVSGGVSFNLAEAGYTGTGDLPDGIESGSKTIVITNITDGQPYSLPETGGTGIGAWTLAGATLAGGTVIALNRKRRRKTN